MGSWAETCAISKLPIQAGDPVLWIYARDTKELYELKSHLFRDLEATRDLEKALDEEEKYVENMSREVRKFMKEEGLLPGPRVSYLLAREQRVRWGFGTYNDYGWVEEERDIGDPILIRKSVAMELAHLGKKLLERITKKYPTEQYLANDFLYCILNLAYFCRIELYRNGPIGQQSPDMLEYETILKVQDIVRIETILEYLREVQRTLSYKNFCAKVWIQIRFTKLLEKLFRRMKHGKH